VEAFGDWQRWNLPYRLPELLRAPTFEKIWSEIAPMFKGIPVVAHNAAAVESLHFASALKGIGCSAEEMPELYCSMEIAKSVWPDLPKYGLKTVARHFDFKLDHHNPVSDARVSGLIVSKAMEHHGVDSITELARIVGYRPVKIDVQRAPAISGRSPEAKGAGGSETKGEVVRWKPTGAQIPTVKSGLRMVLSGMSSSDKKELMGLAKAKGMKCETNVGRSTDLLVASEKMGPAKYAKCKQWKVPIMAVADFQIWLEGAK
jgi:DNA polymerase III subunit epsilon